MKYVSLHGDHSPFLVSASYPKSVGYFIRDWPFLSLFLRDLYFDSSVFGPAIRTALPSGEQGKVLRSWGGDPHSDHPWSSWSRFFRSAIESGDGHSSGVEFYSDFLLSLRILVAGFPLKPSFMQSSYLLDSSGRGERIREDLSGGNDREITFYSLF